MTEEVPPEVKKPASLKELNHLSKKELLVLCAENGLNRSGRRRELFERLKNFYDFDNEVGDAPEDIEDGSDREKDDGPGSRVPGPYGDAEISAPDVSLDPATSELQGSEKDRELMVRLNNLNRARDNREDLKEVLKGYTDLIFDNPENEYLIIHRGICLQYMQDYEGAIQCYVDALKLNPNNIEARMLLDGCRAMGIASAFVDGVSAPVTPFSEESGELEQTPGTELVEKISDKTVEGPDEAIDEKGGAEEEVRVQDEDAAAEAEPVMEKKSVEKIHIAGTATEPKKRSSIIGDSLGDFDTTILTESKSRLTDVLRELKSELKKPSDGVVSEEKPHEHETGSLKEILESSRTDEDFGSRILSSARKLLSLSEDIEYDSEDRSELAKGLDKDGNQNEVDVEHKKGFYFEDKLDLPEREARPRRKRKTAPVKKKLRTGNISLDKLLHGGFMSGSNILINGPTFLAKEIFLYKFATMGFKMDIPCIIVNPDTAPSTIRDRFKELVPDISEVEQKKLLNWLDPEAKEIQEHFKRKRSTDFPEKHQLILDGLDYLGEQLLADFDTYNLIFFSLTPMVMFQEPPVINRFLSKLSKKVKDDNVVALYTIDNTSLEKQEMNFVKRVMDGVLELKQEDRTEEHRDPQKLFKIDKLPDVSSYDWHIFKTGDNNYEIKEIPTYKKVM